MARPSKITTKLEAYVLKLAAQGRSNAKIAVLLGKKGVDVSAHAVGDWLRKQRNDRADTAKVVVREKLTKGLTADLDMLARRTARLNLLAVRVEKLAEDTHNANLVSSGVLNLVIRAQEQLRKQVETNMHFAGADQPDEQVDGLSGFLAMAFADVEAEEREDLIHQSETKVPTLQ